MDPTLKIFLTIWGIIVFIVVVNIVIAMLIHVTRRTPENKDTSAFNILILLIAPYMIYLIVTKQGRVIDDLAIAPKGESKIEKWLKGYPEEKENKNESQ